MFFLYFSLQIGLTFESKAFKCCYSDEIIVFEIFMSLWTLLLMAVLSVQGSRHMKFYVFIKIITKFVILFLKKKLNQTNGKTDY